MIVGVVGLGRMGSAIAHRLLEHGVDVVGWTRDPVIPEILRGGRLAMADHPRAVAERADLIVTAITEDDGVKNIFCGECGFLKADVAGRLFVEMSTLRPPTARELAAKVAAAGARFVDAPVLGTIPTVLEGKLVVLAGGAAEDVAHAKPLFDHVARRVFHLGPNGAGYAMKLAVNLCLANYVEMLAEALSLGHRYDLPLEVMLDILSESPVATHWLSVKRPILSGGEGPTSLDIVTLRKDVMSAVATGTGAGVPMPATSGTLAALSAAVAEGWGDKDIGELPKFFREAMLQNFG